MTGALWRGTANRALIVKWYGGIYGTAPNRRSAPDNPTLENSGNDVHYETDFRSVYSAVIDSWLGGDSVSVLGANFKAGAPAML